MIIINVKPPVILASKIIGIWKLKARENIDTSGHRKVEVIHDSDPLGIICFTAGYFSAQFIKRERSNTDELNQLAQWNENSTLFNDYDVYFGNYQLDENTGVIAIQIQGSVFTENIGKIFCGNVCVLDNELLIQLDTVSPDGTAVIRTNTFERIG